MQCALTCEMHTLTETHTGVVDLRALDPQTPAMVELVRLAEREVQLPAHVDAIGRATRAACAEVADAREALAELERRAAAEPVST